MMDDELLRELMRERSAHVAYARRRLRSEADAEDVVQQALTRALPALGELRHPERVQAWFHRILRRAIADHVSRSVRELAREDVLGVMALASQEEEVGASMAREVGQGGVCHCSIRLLESLPEGLSEVVRRVDLADESVAEAARAIGISPGNVRVRAHRAHERLKAELKACCDGDRYADFVGCQCA